MANKIYKAIESSLLFADSAQTPDENLTLTGLSAGAARISARHDFGAASNSRVFEWRATFQFGSPATVGDTIDIYISTSDGTNPDGEEGTADAAVGSTNSLFNMHYLGSVVVDTASIGTDITSSGVFQISTRYASVVVHNNTSVNFQSSTTAHGVTLTPVPDEIQ